MSTETQSKPAVTGTETKTKPAPTTEPASEATTSTNDAACEAELPKIDRALDVVKKYMVGNAVASLFPVPILDLVAVTGVQLAMVRSVARIYDVPFRDEPVKEIVTTLITGIGTRALALGIGMSLIKIVPGVGTVLGNASVPVMTAALTYAVGKVFILHFEAGGNVLNLDAKKMRAYFQQQYEEGLESAKTLVKSQTSATK